VRRRFQRDPLAVAVPRLVEAHHHRERGASESWSDLHVLVEKLPHEPRDRVALCLQREVPGVEQVVLERLEVPLVRRCTGRREDSIVLPSHDEHRRLVRAEVACHLGYSGGLLP
jgi:hypothetical protein